MDELHREGMEPQQPACPTAESDIPQAVTGSEQPDAEMPQQDTSVAETGSGPAFFAEETESAMPDPFGEIPVFAETEAAAEAAEAEERQPGRLWLRLLAGFFALLVLAFAVFCIIWDVRKGAVSGGVYRAGDIVQVEIVQQSKPSHDTALTDENGRYTYEGIAQAVMPSIVQIYTYSDGTVTGSGSGIILTSDGYIATNAHVVSGADVYSVRFFNDADNDEQVEAILIGHDTKTDLAVIKASAAGLTPAVFGDSDEMKLGEAVCALGNPAGLSGSITTGIISGINRRVRASSTNFEMDCFQTDAAISPGNSGGALVNLYGQVIGITSSKYASSSLFSGGSYEGLGFAITVNEALPILKELMEQGYVSGRVRIGISFLANADAIADLEQSAEEAGSTFTAPDALDGVGIRVMAISEDSDLRNTVLREGDWILRMNGQEIWDYDSVNAALEGCVGGDSVHCRCGRIEEDGSLTIFEIDFALLEDQSGEY